MGRKNRRERKKQKKIIMFSMIGLVCLLSVGYAAFSSEFLISGKGTIVIPENPTAASQLIENVVTTGDGLYADEYEEGRYVYKGAAPANYITFNGEEAGWRIISVEADGTLKIVRNSSIGKYAWDISSSCDAVAYNEKKSTYRDGKYEIDNITYLAPGEEIQGDLGCNEWTRPATLNTYLNETYKSGIDTMYIQTHDFPVGAVTDKNNDLAAQIVAEKSKVWNGDIGLISLSDYFRANTNTAQCGSFSLNEPNYSTCAKTNWIELALNSSEPWTMTPDSSTSSSVFYVDIRGIVYGTLAYNSSNEVAPVLYLKSDITLTGSGSSGDPYEISGI